MAQPVTIDNYDMKTHERYATDQSTVDLKYIEDSDFIPTHFLLARGESTITSKWEELFETHLHRHPFATFIPPSGFSIMRNRFFSHSISPEFDWANTEDNEDEDTNEDERQYVEEYKEKILSEKSKTIPAAIFEKDKNALLNLFDSIEMLNGFLKEVHARKLQYQKG